MNINGYILAQWFELPVQNVALVTRVKPASMPRPVSCPWPETPPPCLGVTARPPPRPRPSAAPATAATTPQPSAAPATAATTPAAAPLQLGDLDHESTDLDSILLEPDDAGASSPPGGQRRRAEPPVEPWKFPPKARWGVHPDQGSSSSSPPVGPPPAQIISTPEMRRDAKEFQETLQRTFPKWAIQGRYVQNQERQMLRPTPPKSPPPYWLILPMLLDAADDSD